MKKITKDNLTTFFTDEGIKKYEYSKNSNGYEYWKEYDLKGNAIHFKNSDGYERWSPDNPNNPNNKEEKVDEKDINPFEFKK